MKNFFIVVAIALFLGIILFIVKFNAEDKDSSDLLENITIENYSFNREPKTTHGSITLVAVNLNDIPIESLPVKISYYSKDGTYLDSDLCDVLDFIDTSLNATGREQFHIDVIFPRGTESVKVKVNR